MFCLKGEAQNHFVGNLVRLVRQRRFESSSRHQSKVTCEYSITGSAPGFQLGDMGSNPVIRTTGNSVTVASLAVDQLVAIRIRLVRNKEKIEYEVLK